MTQYLGKTVNWIHYFGVNGTLRLPGERTIDAQVWKQRETEKFAQLVAFNKRTASGVYQAEIEKLRKLVGLPSRMVVNENRYHNQDAADTNRALTMTRTQAAISERNLTRKAEAE